MERHLSTSSIFGKGSIFAGIVAISGFMLASSASASYPLPNLCNLYGLDLKHNLMLVTPMAANHAAASADLAAARELCQTGKAAEGVALMTQAIGNLGLPLRNH